MVVVFVSDKFRNALPELDVGRDKHVVHGGGDAIVIRRFFFFGQKRAVCDFGLEERNEKVFRFGVLRFAAADIDAGEVFALFYGADVNEIGPSVTVLHSFAFVVHVFREVFRRGIYEIEEVFDVVFAGKTVFCQINRQFGLEAQIAAQKSS